LTILAAVNAQNSTFSPYSRYGLGEMVTPSFAHNTGMGGAFAAWRPDSTMPVFLNTGNPASYPLIRFTSLEVGGTYNYADFKSGSSGVTKWGTNFSYAALGFPVGQRGGGCLGIMPYSYSGFDVSESSEVAGTGTLSYIYNGSGGLSKAFAGYGIMPFYERAAKLRRSINNTPDSLRTLTRSSLHSKYFFAKFLSDLSLGLNVEYLFGNVQYVSRVVYPNSLLYNNTYHERVYTVSDFTGKLGFQSAFTVDSVKSGDGWRPLSRKVKFTMGYALSLNNQLGAEYSNMVYNYVLNGAGNEIVRDTALYNIEQKGNIRLPLQQVFGFGYKKGERFNLVADLGITAWSGYSLFKETNTLSDNYRAAIGFNYVPQKDASGRSSYRKRINYRCGAAYQSGYITVNKTVISDVSVSVGLGLPVGIGRLSSMVHINVKAGRMGPLTGNGLIENYVRVGFGFTFSDKWFQKFRYD
jgi:hypothetical protein